MPRPVSETLTPRESEIMSVLWERGEATADEVRESLRDELHDSTVRTILRVLEGKGYVKHKARGKSYVYRPAVTRAKVERREVRSLLGRIFGGSAEALLLRLIEDEHLSRAQLEELKREVMKRSRTKRRPKGDGGA